MSPRILLARAALVLGQLTLILLVAPFLQGVINRVKAWFAGRNGPPVFQLYYDLGRLWRKGAVLSRTTTWVFMAGPLAGVAMSLAAGLLVPMGSRYAPVSFAGDLVAFAYLFAMGRFLTVLSALDTGSAFEGMGAAREVTFAVLAEPALFLGLAALAMHCGSTSLGPMLTPPAGAGPMPPRGPWP
jgi:formate hydrogenlyase subunit 4